MKAIIVHGGAGDIKRKGEVPERIEACKVSAEKGFVVLASGGSSIDAAVSTGIGEDIMKAVLSFRLMLYINNGAQFAAEKAIEDLTKINGLGGIIALDRYGNFAFPHNTEGMFYAYMKDEMLQTECGV